MRLIAGIFGGRTLRTVQGPGYRPATGRVREALFSSLGSLGLCWSGVRVADVFAGSGALGFEALSRGAARVEFVEKAPAAVLALHENCRELGLSKEQVGIVRQDALRWVRQERGPFHVVFVDPPYGKGLVPQVLAHLARMVLPGGWVIVEMEAGENIPPTPWAMLRNTLYGQTRICIWRNESQYIQEHLTQ